jgi:hypothetical protein
MSTTGGHLFLHFPFWRHMFSFVWKLLADLNKESREDSMLRTKITEENNLSVPFVSAGWLL